MIEKETYWSKFADDLEERTNYVVGKNDIEIIESFLSKQKALGKYSQKNLFIGHSLEMTW
jgi:hypothetical protein